MAQIRLPCAIENLNKNPEISLSQTRELIGKW
jgi:hypothetical protein